MLVIAIVADAWVAVFAGELQINDLARIYLGIITGNRKGDRKERRRQKHRNGKLVTNEMDNIVMNGQGQGIKMK